MKVRSLIIATMQTVGLYAAGLIIPVIGQFLALFAPVPAILSYMRNGRAAGLTVLAASTAVLLALGWQTAFIFVLSFGLMAVGIAEGTRRAFRMENIALLGGLLPVAAGTLLLALYFFRSGHNPFTAADDYFRKSLADAVKLYTDMGLTEMASMVSSLPDRFVYYLVRLIPGIAIATSVIQAGACFGLARALLSRGVESIPVFPSHRFSTWHAPDVWVWGLITALALIIVPEGPAKLTGWNLAILFGTVYLIQGAAIIEFYMLKVHLRTYLRSLLIAIILALPTVVFVIALGVVDIWADIRKVRISPTIVP